MADSSAMTLIQTKTLASAASTIEFTSIPSDGTDILLLASLRNATGNEVFVRFNSDTGNNYAWRRLQGNGTSTFSDDNTDYGGYSAFFYFTYATTLNTDSSNTFGSGNLYITNYSGSTRKSVSSDAALENAATTARMAITAGNWNNTNAITTITITGNGNYEIGSSVSLYKITKGSPAGVVVS